MTPRLDVSMTPEEIRSFLDEPRTAVLSTLGADGVPHLAGMWFVPSRSEIRMWTYGKSQKALNARRDPRAAFLVESGTGYHELKGVMVRGVLEIVEEREEVARIGVLLYERYTLPATGVPTAAGALAEIERQAAKRVGLVLPLDNVASWDHARLGGGQATGRRPS